MAKDVSDVIGTALGNAAREAIQGVSSKGRGRSSGGLSGSKGLAAGAAGAGLLALAPLAGKSVSKLVSGAADNGAGKLKEAGAGALKDAGGKLKDDVGGKLKDDVMDAVPGSGLFGKGSSKSKSVPGVGKGRRMPVQQDIDIGVPIDTVYEQWTQFEEWPKFMHRLQSVSQEDDSHVSFKTKIWGKTKEFKAEIVEQAPGERIKWRVTEGVTHNGVVTFHELGPRLTRVEVNLDVEPGSLLEKAARGMRFVKRAVRADMARFKGYVLMQDEGSDDDEGSSSGGRSSSRQGSSSGRSASGRSGSSSGRSGSSSGRSGSSSGRSGSSASNRSGASASSRSGSSSNGRSRGSSNSRSSNGSSASSRRRSGSRS
jgi:uncharacterized membrane protein